MSAILNKLSLQVRSRLQGILVGARCLPDMYAKSAVRSVSNIFPPSSKFRRFLSELTSSASLKVLEVIAYGMLKNSFNFVFHSRFVQLLRENESFKKAFFKNKMTAHSKYFSHIKFYKIFENNCVRQPLQNNTSYGRPIVLFGGILAFFGLEKPPPEPELIMRIKKGILFIQREQFDKAEAMLHSALTLAQDEKDEDGITYIYDVLANLAFQTGQHAKAEKLFVNVLQRIIGKGEPQDSNKVVDVSLKLAKIFQDTKDVKKAEQGFTFCIETLDKKLEGEKQDEDTLALWGMSMDWYARFLLDTGRKSEALDCFKKAYNMCVKLNGMEHEQTVVLLNDLGTVSSLMGDTETAMNYFEEARDIGNKLPGMKDLAAIYINLGQLYLLREMYKESKTACEEGLKKARQFQDDTASLEAKECLKNIEKVFKNSLGSKDYRLVDSAGSGFKKADLVT